MSYKVEVIADSSGQWSSNAHRFEHVEDAKKAGSDLNSRWMAVKEWRVVPSDEPPSHYWDPERYRAVALPADEPDAVVQGLSR